MFSISNILIGLFMIVVGVLTLRFNYQVVGFTGEPGFITRHLGPGSTYGIYKLFSLLIILVGFLVATGLGAPIMDWILTPLKNSFRVT